MIGSRFHFAGKILVAFLAFLLLPLGSLADSFTDVPVDPLYSPHIQKFLDKNFIFGETNLGEFAGTFRPEDPITRAEYAKLATVTRLAEQVGVSGHWNTLTKLGLVEAVDSRLRPYYQCASMSCSEIGNKPFTDVAEKSPACLEESLSTSSLCQPWYSQYVYYLVDKGAMGGFDDGSGDYSFLPNAPLTRLEALQIALADSPSLSLESDPRYQRLLSLTRLRGSYAPKCLEGAENYILDSNGGNTAAANRLLSLAFLADRLDIFGADCSAFGTEDPLDRAAYLSADMTRQEAPRFFAIATDYSFISPIPGTDPTIHDAGSNNGSAAGNSNYRPPQYRPTGVLNNGNNNSGNNNSNSNSNSNSNNNSNRNSNNNGNNSNNSNGSNNSGNNNSNSNSNNGNYNNNSGANGNSNNNSNNSNGSSNNNSNNGNSNQSGSNNSPNPLSNYISPGRRTNPYTSGNSNNASNANNSGNSNNSNNSNSLSNSNNSNNSQGDSSDSSSRDVPIIYKSVFSSYDNSPYDSTVRIKPVTSNYKFLASVEPEVKSQHQEASSGWFDNFKSSAGSFFSSAGHKVVDAAIYVKDKTVDAAKYVGNKVLDATKYVGNKIVDGAKYVKDKVVSVGEKAVSFAKDVGKKVVGTVQYVQEKAVSIGQKAVDTAKNIGASISDVFHQVFTPKRVEGFKQVGWGLLELTGGGVQIAGGVTIAGGGTVASGGLAAIPAIAGGGLMIGLGTNYVVGGATNFWSGLKNIFGNQKTEINQGRFNPIEQGIDHYTKEGSWQRRVGWTAYIAADLLSTEGVFKSLSKLNEIRKVSGWLGVAKELVTSAKNIPGLKSLVKLNEIRKVRGWLGVAENLVTSAKNISGKAWQAIKEAPQKTLTWVKEAPGRIVSDIKEFAGLFRKTIIGSEKGLEGKKLIQAFEASTSGITPLQKEKTLSEIIASASKAKPNFDSTLDDIAKEFRGEAIHVPLKTDNPAGYERSLKKIEGKYASPQELKDVLRGSAVFDNLDDLHASMTEIVQKYGKENVVEVKNYFQNPKGSGYRAIHVTVRTPEGSLGEIQLQVRSIYDAKQIETPINNARRALDLLPETPKTEKAIAELDAQSKKIYEAAWAEVKNKFSYK